MSRRMRRRRLQLWIGASALVHLPVVVLTALVLAPDRERAGGNRPLDPSSPIFVEPVRSPAREGQSDATSKQRAADSLYQSTAAGARAAGRARAEANQLTGRSDQRMSARFPDHLERDAVLRTGRRSARARSPDNRAATRRREARARSGRHEGSPPGLRPGEARQEEEEGRERAADPHRGVGVAPSQLARSPSATSIERRTSQSRIDHARAARWSHVANDTTTRAQASRHTRMDLTDLARPSASGTDTGRAQGSPAARAGLERGTQANGPVWLNTTDDRYFDYFRGIYRRVQPLWRFPRDLQVLMEQGEVLVRFVIREDGELEDLRVVRSSGYRRFDSNVVAALRRAAPFDPLPDQIGDSLTVLAPFEFTNPLIR